RNNYSKMQITGTFASCMTLQHGLKAFVFTFVGFSFVQWAGLIVAMVLSGAFGTYVGLKVLKRVPTQKFMLAFKLVVTLLAFRLLWQAFQSM
ncbi:MAG: sulfite exporter TauE/SafE family protein, partial [Pseudomonadota bacterium]|nr:sulfite exporter TauE/SafE family protein [Pseudomonadota bacterium]